jgi:hypothetical protein
LYQAFEHVRKLGGNVLYCDTDSMIIDKCLETSGKWELFCKNFCPYMGDFTNEFDFLEPKECTIVAPKFYGFKDKFIKCKGFYKSFMWHKKSTKISKKGNLKILFTEPVYKPTIKTDLFTLTYEDLQLMNQGAIVKTTVWRFDAKSRQLFDGMEMKKDTVEITLKKVVSKGREENGIVQPIFISNQKGFAMGNVCPIKPTENERITEHLAPELEDTPKTKRKRNNITEKLKKQKQTTNELRRLVDDQINKIDKLTDLVSQLINESKKK